MKEEPSVSVAACVPSMTTTMSWPSLKDFNGTAREIQRSQGQWVQSQKRTPELVFSKVLGNLMLEPAAFSGFAHLFAGEQLTVPSQPQFPQCRHRRRGEVLIAGEVT